MDDMDLKLVYDSIAVLSDRVKQLEEDNRLLKNTVSMLMENRNNSDVKEIVKAINNQTKISNDGLARFKALFRGDLDY